MGHGNHREYQMGQNVFSGTGSWSPVAAVDLWYNELKQNPNMAYREVPNSNAFNSFPCGHFTQVVWRGTEKVGMARATGRDGKVYIVANYYPSGNMMGSFQNNVMRCRDIDFEAPLKDSGKSTVSTVSTSMSSSGSGSAQGCALSASSVSSTAQQQSRDWKVGAFTVGGGYDSWYPADSEAQATCDKLRASTESAERTRFPRFRCIRYLQHSNPSVAMNIPHRTAYEVDVGGHVLKLSKITGNYAGRIDNLS